MFDHGISSGHPRVVTHARPPDGARALGSRARAYPHTRARPSIDTMSAVAHTSLVMSKATAVRGTAVNRSAAPQRAAAPRRSLVVRARRDSNDARRTMRCDATGFWD